MSTNHRITGDGESDNGVGCCAMTWTLRTLAGSSVTGTTYAPAPSLYIEDPHNDTDTASIPTMRSDTLGTLLPGFPMTGGPIYPDVSAVAGRDVTLTINVLPTNEIGTAIVDSAGAVFYVTAATDATTIEVDRTGMATGTIQGFYPPVPCTVTYGIHAEGFPILEKFYEMGWVNYQLLRGGRQFRYVTRSFGAEDATTTTQTVVYDSDLTSRLYDDREYQRRMMVPREQTRAIGLQVSVVMGDPICYWQLGAMAYTYRPTSDRTEARRA